MKLYGNYMKLYGKNNGNCIKLYENYIKLYENA